MQSLRPVRRVAELGSLDHSTRMKYLAVIFIALVAVAGCKTPTREVVTTPLWPKERLAAIYADLKTEPLPAPSVTPFDTDARQRDAYLAGFKDGWDFAICGDILFGFRSQPLDLPPDLRSAWQGGWREGTKIGGERLLTKLQDRK